MNLHTLSSALDDAWSGDRKTACQTRAVDVYLNNNSHSKTGAMPVLCHCVIVGHYKTGPDFHSS